MELYESGQLEKSDILDKIINEQEILNIFFRRSISNATRANTAMKYSNEIAECGDSAGSVHPLYGTCIIYLSYSKMGAGA